MIRKFVMLVIVLQLMACASIEKNEQNVKAEPESIRVIEETVVIAAETRAVSVTREPPLNPSPFPTVAVSEPAEAVWVTISPADERINTIGRFDFRDPSRPAFDWSAAGIEFVFSGTAAKIFLEDGRNSYNVSVDGQKSVLKTELGESNYAIASGLAPGEHVVRIIKRNEAYVGAAVFGGLQIFGSGLKQPPAKRERTLEFIGDSITTGYGNEGDSPDCWFTPATQNAELSYAAIAANELRADYSLIALSGLGVVRNLRSENAMSADTAIDFIDRSLAMNPSTSSPAQGIAPSAVIINLGTNDYSSLPFPEEESFVQAYVQLLQAVRARYPESTLFAVAGPLMLEPAPSMIRLAAERYGAIQGDDRIVTIEIENNLEQSAEDFGCDWHPNVNGQRKIASQIIPIIARELGW